MPKISKIFNLGASQAELDFVDITTDRDTRLFLEPFAISLQEDAWSEHCQDHIVSFFDFVIQAIRRGDDSLAIQTLNYLSEPEETGLGFSTKRGRGRGVRGSKAMSLYYALKRSRAVKTGLLTDLGEADLFIEGISVDGLSDIAASVLRGPLIEYTQAQCSLWDIELRKNVAVGYIWDPTLNKWHHKYADMPIAKDRHVLMVPKYSVRRALLLDSQEFYNKHILEYIQQQELIRGSNLVHLLKNGKQKVYKKELKPKNPFSKDFLARFSSENPSVLDSYKKMYKDLPDADGAPKNSELDKGFNEAVFCQAVIKSLQQMPSGNDNATAYHRLIIGVLEYLFYPSLIYPTAEQKLHEGRKRIDISYTNAAKSGFFERALKSSIMRSSMVPVECKNYSKDPKNPELDQLAGRFGDTRGKLGFLCYRGCSDENTLIKRCADTALDGRGFIIPLGDNNIEFLLNLASQDKRDEIDQWLNARLTRIRLNN